MTDPLASAEARRSVWASIVDGLLDRGPEPGRDEAARMALEFALMEEPPRDWPPYCAGWYMVHGWSMAVSVEGPGEMIAAATEIVYDRPVPSYLLSAVKDMPAMPAMVPGGAHHGFMTAARGDLVRPNVVRITYDLSDLAP